MFVRSYNCSFYIKCVKSCNIKFLSLQAVSYFLTLDENGRETLIPLGTESSPYDNIDKSVTGDPLVR
jgi:hypothetical protein